MQEDDQRARARGSIVDSNTLMNCIVVFNTRLERRQPRLSAGGEIIYLGRHS